MADIYLHNTLTGEKELFKPLKEGRVSMYNCGPTVYNYAHIGNLRSYVFADILRRTFEYNGYKVDQVINVTDIGHLSSDNDDGEDKMTKALKREGKPLTLEAMREVANFYFEEFKKDLTALNIELPEHFPFASDHIQEDIDLVQTLADKGFTYTTSDGIYFDTSKFPEYGKLGNIKVGDESRIGVNSEKKNYRDFAVWKFNNELGYDAPFGKGFPGWHIECSAMSVKYLGPEFDIHTGGIDHIPVHHNNEIAQSICAGNPYARVWMHNAHLNMGEEKMAKSGDNFITLQTLKNRDINPIALRYVFLGARYSSPLQFSWEALEGANTAIKKLKNVLNNIEQIDESKNINEKLSLEYKTKFNLLINDDLDTPQATSLIWEVFRNDEISFYNKKTLILEFDKVLGLELDKVEIFEIPNDVQYLIKERDLARNAKDFAKSDELRAKIEEIGFEVKDTPEGTVVVPR
jgi:cysteinyl-tRNA synthetase